MDFYTIIGSGPEIWFEHPSTKSKEENKISYKIHGVIYKQTDCLGKHSF